MGKVSFPVWRANGADACAALLVSSALSYSLAGKKLDERAHDEQRTAHHFVLGLCRIRSAMLHVFAVCRNGKRFTRLGVPHLVQEAASANRSLPHHLADRHCLTRDADCRIHVLGWINHINRISSDTARARSVTGVGNCGAARPLAEEPTLLIFLLTTAVHSAAGNHAGSFILLGACDLEIKKSIDLRGYHQVYRPRCRYSK